MLVNAAALRSIYTGFNTIFNETFQVTEVDWPKVAMEVPSTSDSEEYDWLDDIPMLREWIGERHIHNMKALGFALKNKSFELTVGVDRDKIEDDKMGIYRPRIQNLGSSAKVHPDSLVFSLLKNGASLPCFDGQYFFDTDHVVNGASVSNYGGGTGAMWALLDTTKPLKPLVFQPRRAAEFVAKDNPTDENVFKKKEFLYGVDYRGNAGYGFWQLAYASKQALDATNYAAARAAMLSRKNNSGVPLLVKPNLLVVDPVLEGEALALVKSQVNAAGASNPWYGTAEVLVCPWLA